VIIGVPAERKSGEARVALSAAAVGDLVGDGISVLVEEGAGAGSAIPDAHYREVGAELLPDAAEVWAHADLVSKVKEPQPDEYSLLRPGLALFCFLHLAAAPRVTEALLESRVTAVSFETVEAPDGSLPLLAPMSEIAGRLAPQVAARFLQSDEGGRGVLLAGAPGVRPGHVLVLGAGNVGRNAAKLAVGMGADVVLVDRDLERLRRVEHRARGRITTLASHRMTIEELVAETDVVVGAVLVTGGRAPTLVSEEMVASMRTGSVIVDVSIDQGGCIETSRETTHAEPVYEQHGVLHYAVGNMPGCVPRTATAALSNAILPYVRTLARAGVRGALEGDRRLRAGVNTLDGELVCPPVGSALGWPTTSLDEVLDTAARA